MRSPPPRSRPNPRTQARARVGLISIETNAAQRSPGGSAAGGHPRHHAAPGTPSSPQPRLLASRSNTPRSPQPHHPAPWPSPQPTSPPPPALPPLPGSLSPGPPEPLSYPRCRCRCRRRSTAPGEEAAGRKVAAAPPSERARGGGRRAGAGGAGAAGGAAARSRARPGTADRTAPRGMRRDGAAIPVVRAAPTALPSARPSLAASALSNRESGPSIPLLISEHPLTQPRAPPYLPAFTPGAQWGHADPEPPRHGGDSAGTHQQHAEPSTLLRSPSVCAPG